MAKVELPDNLLAGLVPGLQGRKPERKREAAKAVNFRGALREAGSAEAAEATPAALGLPYNEAEAAALLDAVTTAGDDIKRDANAEAVKAYKTAVRDFVHYVVERAYALDERTSGRNVLKRKRFTTVIVIDEKLERLAAEVLSAQRDKLDILRRIDEIHGLLVDLMR